FQFIQEKANENPFIELTQKEDQPNFYQRTSTNSDNDTFDPIMNATKTETSLHEYLFEQLLHLELTEEEMNVIQYFVLNINEHGFLKYNSVSHSFHILLIHNEVIARISIHANSFLFLLQLLHLELTEEEMNVIQYFVLNINEHGFLDME